jgi:hypothetical protein
MKFEDRICCPVGEKHAIQDCKLVMLHQLPCLVKTNCWSFLEVKQFLVKTCPSLANPSCELLDCTQVKPLIYSAAKGCRQETKGLLQSSELVILVDKQVIQNSELDFRKLAI